MKTERGWVAIYRKVDEGRYWLKEKFTKGQAWVDLIMLANHKEDETYVRGINLKMERGQLFWSQEALSKRWRWSKDKVQNYLKDLEKHEEISYKVVNKIGVITVLNYNNYQDFSPQTSLQTSLQKTYKTALNNNVNNVKNENNKEIEISRLEEIAKKYNVSIKSVEDTYEELTLYCKSSGKTYKDYEATLMNWIRRKISEGKLKTQLTQDEELELEAKKLGL